MKRIRLQKEKFYLKLKDTWTNLDGQDPTTYNNKI